MPASVKADVESAIAEIFADFETLDDHLEKMRDAAAQMCRDMAAGVQPYWLSLLGTSGAGKTMLAKKVVRFFRRCLDSTIDQERSHETHIYRRYGGMLEWFKCMRLMIEDSDFGFLRQAREDWLVGLDDIAAEHLKHRELSASKLYDILCSREKKWTIVTANLSVEQIAERLDARVASRLLRHGAVVIDVDVPDFNLRKYLVGKAAA